jgi:hypothetical protein
MGSFSDSVENLAIVFADVVGHGSFLSHNFWSFTAPSPLLGFLVNVARVVIVGADPFLLELLEGSLAEDIHNDIHGDETQLGFAGLAEMKNKTREAKSRLLKRRFDCLIYSWAVCQISL